MHRWSRVTVVLLLLCTSGLLAQVDEQEEPVPPKRSSQTKIGGGLGLTPSMLFLDLGPINRVLTAANAAPFEKNALYMFGGQLYGYILFVPNLRVGGLAAGGRMETGSLEQATGTRRDVRLSVGIGGVTVDYVVPLVPRLDLTVGTLLGGGNMKVVMTRDNGGGKIWGDLWSEYGSSQPVQEYSRTLEGSFFVYQPSVTLEYAVFRWLGVRAGVSYLGMSGGSWKLDDQHEVFGVPEDINAKGWMITTGLFIGTFVF